MVRRRLTTGVRLFCAFAWMLPNQSFGANPMLQVPYTKQDLREDIATLFAPYASGRVLGEQSQVSNGGIFIIDMPDIEAVRNYRTSLAVPKSPRKGMADLKTEGLARLRLWLHGQPSLGGLRFLMQDMDRLEPILFPGKEKAAKRYFIDLREEHVFFLESARGEVFPVSYFSPRNWHNLQKSGRAIHHEANVLLAELRQSTSVRVYDRLSTNELGEARGLVEYEIPLRAVHREEDLVTQLGAHYKHLRLTDHRAMRPSTIDRFLRFYRAEIEGQEVILSLHCRAGRGRTTSVALLLDILQNSDKLSFAEIVQRQHAIGGIDVRRGNEDYRKVHAAARAAMLEAFYQYVSSGSYAAGIQTFSVWQAAQRSQPWQAQQVFQQVTRI